MRRPVVAVTALLIATALAACSGSSPEPSGGSATPTPASSPSNGTPEFAPVETMATEPGPRPLLEWVAVDGADEYHVSVYATSGDAYWSWSGPKTQVHVGGIADPNAVGPHVFEDMTWVVVAATVDGTVLAMSEPAALTP